MAVGLGDIISQIGTSVYRLVKGKDVDITQANDGSGHTITDNDIFIIDDSAAGTQASTKYVEASQIKTYVGATGGANVENAAYSVGWDGDTTNAPSQNAVYDKISSIDTKLDGIEAGATADQTAPEIRILVGSATDSNVFTDADHSKLDGIEASADVTDTANVVAALTAGTNIQIAVNGTISATDTNTQLTDAEVRSKISGTGLIGYNSSTGVISTTANNYVHPTTAGNKHIPTGGAAGQFLKYSSSGTAVWAAPSYTTNTDTQLSNEQVQDIAGGMVTGNTESGITVTYQDTDGTIDFSVASQTDHNFTTALKTKLEWIETGATADQTATEIRTLVETATDSNVFTDADHLKLNAIEASADVTNATNVTTAGALMDSEVANLAQVKAFNSSNYATAAQGTTADAALPLIGGTMTGDISHASNFTLDIGGDLTFDADGGNVNFKDASVGDKFIKFTTAGGKTNAYFYDPADITDWFTFTVGSSGSTIFKTEDGAGANSGHMTFFPEGNIIFRTNTDTIIFKNSGNTQTLSLTNGLVSIGGSWTFDFTGGVEENLWNTSSSHGLVIGDIISFTSGETALSIGGNWTFDATPDEWTTSIAHGLVVNDVIQFDTSGAAGQPRDYDIDTDYYVVAVGSSTTVQLSATQGGAVIVDTTSSSSAWTAIKNRNYAIDTDYYVVNTPSTTSLQLSTTESGVVLAGIGDSTINWFAKKKGNIFDAIGGLNITGNIQTSSKPGYSGYLPFMITSGFNYDTTAGTKVYIPVNGSTREETSLAALGANEGNLFIAPFDGYVEQILFRSEDICGSSIVGIHKSSDGTELPSPTASNTITVNMSSADTSYKFNFGLVATFNAGDILAFSFTPTNDTNDTNATVMLRMDTTTFV